MPVAIAAIAGSNVTPVEYDWPLARDRAAEIDRYWEYRLRDQPHLFNGAMCLLKDWSIENGMFVAECFNTDYKTFLWWREQERPDRNVFDFFGAAALHTLENWLILGLMADQTASRGWLYPPCGSPIPSDIRDGKLDIDGSLIRETFEETGIVLVPEQLGPALIIGDGARIVYVRPVRLNTPASSLITEITRFIDSQPEAELESVQIVRGRIDLDAKTMPPFVSIYVRYAFA
jgi:hypothetical protein